jgi:hypothetical protein
MSLLLLSCPKCRAPLADSLLNQLELTPCPTCAVPLQVEVFPALFRQAAAGKQAETILVDSDASCFYHPQKKAVLPCEGCGRFLCALCDCELHGQHFCPACLETGRKKGKIKKLENERVRYDSIALALSILPLLIFYLTFITAPMALFFAIRYWNAPRSLVHATKIRAVLAIIFASLQIVGWAIVLYFIFTGHFRAHG